MKNKGWGLGSTIIFCAVLLLIAGTYLSNPELTSLGWSLLNIIFWVIVVLSAIVLILFALFVLRG